MTTFVTDTDQSDVPRRRLMTVEEFDSAWALGIYGPEERLELIAGEVLVYVTPQESLHATGIRLLDRAMNRLFSEGYDVRTQLPLVLDPHNRPEPDVCIVAGSIRDYAAAHPTTARLVIEVSDSTLRYDRTTKAGLYARAGIAEILDFKRGGIVCWKYIVSPRQWPTCHSVMATAALYAAHRPTPSPLWPLPRLYFPSPTCCHKET